MKIGDGVKPNTSALTWTLSSRPEGPVIDGVNELVGIGDIPLLAKEGWTRHQENTAKHPLKERTGWSIYQNVSECGFASYLTTPSAPLRSLRDIFSLENKVSAMVEAHLSSALAEVTRPRVYLGLANTTANRMSGATA